MDNMSLADIAAVTNKDNDGFFGDGGGFFWIVVLFLVSGMMGGGLWGNNNGLYRISYDVTSTPGAAGAQIVQLYSGASAMPCAIATDTVAADGIITQHVETVVRLSVCCASQPVISAQISGVAGTVNHVCASVVKLA